MNKTLKQALNRINGKRKKSKVKKGYDYSKYWMSDYSNAYEKFSGLTEGMSTSSDLAKLIKLTNYRRAVSNFVKILTGKDIPVTFSGSTSYTDGKAICISTDIKDNNFDVTVGLALHEGSHILLSDFEFLRMVFDFEKNTELLESFAEDAEILRENLNKPHSPLYYSVIKDMWNWIEDRRIDNYVFKTSPGYKAYYHKLYDHYWHADIVTKGLISDEYRDPSDRNSYMFRITNLINPVTDLKALPGLDKIAAMIDLRNISRLTDSKQSLTVALQVLFEVHRQLEANPSQAGQTAVEKIQPSPQGDSPDNSNGAGTSINLTSAERNALDKAIEKQENMLRGNIKKKAASQRLQKRLESFSGEAFTIESVGPDRSIECVMLDLTKQQNTLAALEAELLAIEELREQWRTKSDKQAYAVYESKTAALDDSNCYGLSWVNGRHCYSVTHKFGPCIQQGLDVGALLGKKIQIRSEVRERVDNRLKTGHIDNKRLAHAGYGIESIFKQISIDKYKKINLHLSLDASGSMNGEKWHNTIIMAIAIAKSATMVNNINVQVSIRSTYSGRRSESPVNVLVYDSTKNKLHHLLRFFRMHAPNSMTPEGLCFEGMLKQRLIIPSKTEMDSYFINLSDGEPSCGNYCGSKAHTHTAAQVRKMQSMGVSVIGYFMTTGVSDSSYKAFTTMYGSKNSRLINPTSAVEIAKTLNERFMEAKETV